MDISVIIVNYNVREFLLGALRSLRKSLDAGGYESEIFVVDNASRDGSVEMVAAEFPEVKLRALKENVGFGKANNLALREATGEYLLILNPDTILGEDTIRVMMDFMRSHPDAGADRRSASVHSRSRPPDCAARTTVAGHRGCAASTVDHGREAVHR